MEPGAEGGARRAAAAVMAAAARLIVEERSLTVCGGMRRRDPNPNPNPNPNPSAGAAHDEAMLPLQQQRPQLPHVSESRGEDLRGAAH